LRAISDTELKLRFAMIVLPVGYDPVSSVQVGSDPCRPAGAGFD